MHEHVWPEPGLPKKCCSLWSLQISRILPSRTEVGWREWHAGVKCGQDWPLRHIRHVPRKQSSLQKECMKARSSACSRHRDGLGQQAQHEEEARGPRPLVTARREGVA